MSTTLVNRIAERLGISTNDAAAALDALTNQIGRIADREGTVNVPGLGIFEQRSGTLSFQPAEDLQEAVNHRFAGLEAIDVNGGDTTTVVPPLHTPSESDELERDAVPNEGGESIEVEVAPALDIGEEPEIVEELKIEIAEPPEVDTLQTADAELEFVAGDEARKAAPSVFEEHEDEELDVDSDRRRVSVETTLEDEAEALERAIVSKASEWAPDVAEETMAASTALDVFGDRADDEEDGADEKAEVEGTVEKEAIAKKVVPVKEAAKRRPAVAARSRPGVVSRFLVPVLGAVAIVAGIVWLLQREPATLTTSTPAITNNEGVGETATGETVTATETEGGQTPAGGEAGVTTPTPPADPTPVAVETWQPGAFASGTGGWTIVVSSEPTEAEARGVARAIAANLSDEVVDLIPVDVNGETRYRVGVGQFSSAAAANQALRRISGQLPQDSWVTAIQ